MSSPAAATAGPESVITVKINYEGCTRRAKMVLRDMVPGQLEQQVRAFLPVPSDQELTIERYSDSAGAYVVLDTSNMPVYKQLYRAAKAKSKLKLRVTNPNTESKPVPRPVTVEEVPDAPSTNDAPSSETTIKQDELALSQTPTPSDQQPAGTPRNPVEVTLTPTASGPGPVHNISKMPDNDTLAKTAKQIADFESMRADLAQRLKKLSEIPGMPPPAAVPCAEEASRRLRLMYDMQMARIEARQKASSPTTTLQEIGTHNTQAFAVCCNSCDKTMPDVHYHCSTCDDGDFDLCSTCVDLGITCHSPSHWMIKRTTINGQIVNSTTEVIAKPKKDIAPKIEEKRNFVPWNIEKEGRKLCQTEERPKFVSPSIEEKRKIPVKVEEKPGFAPAKPGTCYTPQLAGGCYGSASPNAVLSAFNASFSAMRTCNNCIGSFPEKEFLHCTTCEDFDLCKTCFAKNQHGHHPAHGFTAAVSGTELSETIKVKLAPGRNQMHHAICDGCDQYIMGVRHKCLDCPDWDYCSSCHPNAHFIHPGHRFVPVYTPLGDNVRVMRKFAHQGICCDGPLCANDKGYPSYIRGIRYKCAVCDDVDFCANCEAHPQLDHNKTHPLIKIKTPVRHINVTTTGEKGDGSPMRLMGDGAGYRRYPPPVQASTADKVPETKFAPVPVMEKQGEVPGQASPFRRAESPEKSESVEKLNKAKLPSIDQLTQRLNALSTQPPAGKPEPKEQDLNATFVRDTVVDGTIMPPNNVFEQSWVLRNEGSTAWPAGCSVKYVGGDYMGHVDSNHPAEISRLVSASESIVCYDSLAPGQEFAFTVLLRSPSRPGKFVSYWRLSTPEGLKFGHRLWCDVVVRPAKVEETKPVVIEEDAKVSMPLLAREVPPTVPRSDETATSSLMIFPKLEKESPASSMHEGTRVPSPVAPSTVADDKVSSAGVPDESAEDEDWDVSEDGFLTDEEYDILDASDEEFLEEQAKKLQK